MLEPYRVLDLTDERGQLAGMMLADLGAEVILIEPPEGSRSRAVGPFVQGREGDPEASLWFWSYNRGKRSLTLDLDTEEGQSRLKALVKAQMSSSNPLTWEKWPAAGLATKTCQPSTLK